MPRLLRRAAPSPTVDELALASRAPPLKPTLSFVSDGSFSGSQRCAVHGFSRTSFGRRRSMNSSETENSSSEERDSQENNQSLAAVAAEAAAEVDAGEAATPREKEPAVCTCAPSRRSNQSSSKRLSVRLEDLAATAIEDGPDGEPETNDAEDSDSVCSHDRESTCVKCEIVRDSVSSSTSSRVVIRDTQLAALDVELQNLKRTFVKSMYDKLSRLSTRLGKRGGTQQIANN